MQGDVLRSVLIPRKPDNERLTSRKRGHREDLLQLSAIQREADAGTGMLVTIKSNSKEAPWPATGAATRCTAGSRASHN